MFGNNSATFSMPVVPAGYSAGNSGNSWGDDWLALAALALIFGWGNGGFGFGNGMFGGGMGGMMNPFMFGGFPYGHGAPHGDYATQADVRAAVDQQTLISKLDQQTYGLADSTYALNNTITNGFHGVDNAICNLGYNVQQGFNTLGHQLSDCCCQTQRAIDSVNYNMATQACETRNAIANSTRDILESNNANTRAILDFLTTDKIAALQAENQNLKLKASQADQNAVLRAAMDANTAEIIRRTGNDCPVPAYVVPNPNCCYNPFGFGYTPNSGCGCA